MEWFNYVGFIFIVAIMIPNIVFAAKHKDGFKNYYKNKIVEAFEQIGRIGSFLFIFFTIPPCVKGFWFNGGFIAYCVIGSAITLAYIMGWIAFWKETSVRKSLYLSIVPSLLFIVCGVLTLNIPLIVSSVIFAPCHIFISYKNAKAEVEEKEIDDSVEITEK